MFNCGVLSMIDMFDTRSFNILQVNQLRMAKTSEPLVSGEEINHFESGYELAHDEVCYRRRAEA